MKFNLKKCLLVGLMTTFMATTMLAGCGKKDNSEDSATAAPTEEVAEESETESGEEADEPETTETPDASNISLNDTYKDLFTIGVAVNSWQLSDKDTLDVITKDFSSITCENEMKPDYVLDYNATLEASDGLPVINMENVDNIMKMAEDAGLKMRGHTLVWHSQTPDWLFYEDYDIEKDYVDRDTMLKRMEAYIERVLTYCNEEHPGLVYAWDVVNEAASDAPGVHREDSKWYMTVGEDYVEKAFEFARKYAADDTKLFYNDYGCTGEERRSKICEILAPVYEAGNLDGIGMQSHHDKNLNVFSVKDAIKEFSQFEGIEIQLTELDLHNTDNSEDGFKKQADMYKSLMKIVAEMDMNGDANITNVTFWGLNDSTTWLTGFRKETSYPLLFHEDNTPKPCYFSINEVVAELNK